MVSPSSERFRLYLHRAGYGVTFRAEGWAECFVSLAAERWIGRGVTEDEALDDALRRMLPSRLARALFDAQFAAATDESASDPAPPLVTTAAPDNVEPPASPEHDSVVEPTEASQVTAIVSGTEIAEVTEVAEVAEVTEVDAATQD